MANIYPNNNAALFGAWILANSNIRVTPARKIQIQTIITQAQTGGYVAQLYYSEFIAYTNQWYAQYLQYNNQEPAIIPTTYDPLTTAWLAALGTAPAQQTIYSVDAFFRQLRADGNLLLDYFFLFAQDNQANAWIDLINPTLYAVTEHNTPTWNANQGYTGNGTNMYLSVNYIDSTSGTNYTLNNAMFGAYTRSTLAAASKSLMGSDDGTNYNYIYQRYTGNLMINIINGYASYNPANTLTQGNFLLQRTANNAINIYREGVSLGTNNAASTGLSSKQDYIMAVNNNGTPIDYNNNQYTCAYKGSGAINPVTFNSAVNLLMTNLGAHY